MKTVTLKKDEKSALPYIMELFEKNVDKVISSSDLVQITHFHSSIKLTPRKVRRIIEYIRNERYLSGVVISNDDGYSYTFESNKVAEYVERLGSRIKCIDETKKNIKLSLDELVRDQLAAQVG